MKPKPRHLSDPYPSQFKDAGVVAAYRHRPPYPAETLAILLELLGDRPRRVLDLGCGSGAIARPLAASVDRVDAVDFSDAMIQTGKGLPGGDRATIRWIAASAEEAALDPPYGLVTAGQSLHWMAWEVVLPRVRAALTESGFLALVDHVFAPVPWDEALLALLPRYSTNQDYEPYDLVEELEARGLFEKHGERRTAFVPLRNSVDDYVESCHSRNGFSRERMGERSAAAFDDEVRGLVLPHVPGGTIETSVAARIVWGRPRVD